MSYARFSEDSDVYVFGSVNGYVECCGCILNNEWEHYSFESLKAHLEEHVAQGHKVPAALLEESTYDKEDFGKEKDRG